MTRYTVVEAAKRVKRSRRTIERWIADEQAPLPVHWWSNVRYIHEKDLLAEMRRRNLADPSKPREMVAEKRRAERVRRELAKKYRRVDIQM